MNGARLPSVVGLVSLPILVSCGASPPKPAPETPAHPEHNEHAHAEEAASTSPSAAVTEEERTAYEKARPVFETYCAKCHTTQGNGSAMAMHHFNMDTYPFGGHHATQITATIREVLGASGKPATMPRDNPGAVKGQDLQVILAWADAYDRAHPKSRTSDEAHHHDDDDEHMHEHEDEEHEHQTR
jgi:hypothetical protein